MIENEQDEDTISTAKQALADLSAAMQADPSYAWSWHCNLAMMARDAGAPLQEANKYAADFMLCTFGVDTSHNEHYDDKKALDCGCKNMSTFSYIFLSILGSIALALTLLIGFIVYLRLFTNVHVY